MCGIVGYIGKKNAVPFLLDGLEKLEYRGYDSSGIAININNSINVTKKQGYLKKIRDILDKKNYCSNIGIGHTRWATHGNPTDENSHPHVSMCGKFAVVHNGIIENYIELKEKLINLGYKFNSETDSEVIVNILSDLYKSNNNILDCVIKTVNMLQGSYALGIMCSEEPDMLIAVKKDSPLIIGVSENENYIASDVPALLSNTHKICRLPEKNVAIIKYNNFELYDFDKNRVNIKLDNINWSVDSADKNNYEHYMLKEIMEQPESINSTILNRIIKNNNQNIVKLDNVNFSSEYLNNLNKIYIVACGSAYHVGCVAKYFMESLLRIPVEVDLASEFRYRNPIVNKNNLVIIISQSGETADSLAALREAKKLGARVLSIVNVIGSSIAVESHDVLYTQAGPEIAVATTKAYSTQLIIIYLLTLKIYELLQKHNNLNYNNILDNIQKLPEKINNILQNNNIKNISKKYFNNEKVFFIGRNIDYSVCMEASLKLKEISYIHSEAYAAGELKHGTISLIDNNTLVVALATQDDLVDKIISNVREVRARGASVLFITTENHKHKLQNICEDIIIIPESHELLSASLTVIPLQLFAYYIALYRNCDIDKPKNLAKSVTVE